MNTKRAKRKFGPFFLPLEIELSKVSSMSTLTPQNKKPINKIGVYTSGGDAPGMNAALRAVVRVAIHYGKEVVGIYSGYTGMIEDKFTDLNPRSMANILQRGGTILKSGRSPLFTKPEGRAKAYENLVKRSIDGLICIGGNGSLTGANLLYEEHGMPYIAIPGTIDNDIYGTESTIGFDTALNTALEAVDRLRDTAASHDRLMIVEVMGRDSGFIALETGIAGGAEEIFIPEVPMQVDAAIEKIKKGIEKGKLSSILITAEGQKPGRAYDLAEAIRKKTGFDAKVCILGHVQRGGSPTAADRILASRLGAAAVEYLIHGYTDLLIGVQKNEITPITAQTALSRPRTVDKTLLDLARVLST